MSEPATEHGCDRSLAGFYSAVGAVALLAALGAGLVPLVQLNHHARDYRTGHDKSGRSLGWVVGYAARHRMDQADLRELLGEPGMGGSCFFAYFLNSGASPDDPHLVGYWISLDGGRISRSEPLRSTQDPPPAAKSSMEDMARMLGIR